MSEQVRWVDPRHEQATMAAIERLACTAYGFPSFANHYLVQAAVQPDGIGVVERDGVPVASACWMAYPDGGFGWIGMVATDPDCQRQGLGQEVTEAAAEQLEQRRCRPVLDASAAGFPLYERMGFTDIAALHLVRRPTASADEQAGRDERGVRPLPDADTVVDFDRERFGGSRRRIIEVLAERFECFAAGGPGAPTGWMAVQGDLIGPVVADDADTARALIATGLSHVGAGGYEHARMYVTEGSGAASWLADDGWSIVRSLRHMRRGPGQLPGRRSSIIAQVTPGFG